MLLRGFLRRGVVVVFLVDEMEIKMLVAVVFLRVTSVFDLSYDTAALLLGRVLHFLLLSLF